VFACACHRPHHAVAQSTEPHEARPIQLKTIASIVGARPQFIKLSPVLRALRAAGFARSIVIHTGQHYDANMSQVFFDEMDMAAPDRHLGVGSGAHGEQTGRMLVGIERALMECRPEWVLVFGDTNSTLAGAVAASKLCIPVAHVEAGLRSFNRAMPEEFNRVLADRVADLLFAPTEAAVGHLRREGAGAGQVHRVGDVMYDAALYFAKKAGRVSDVLSRFGLTAGQYVLATIHRAENTDDADRLRAIVAGLRQAAERWPVVWPVHPRTRAALERQWFSAALGGVRCVAPVGYLDMVQLERHAAAIATDSGGVQKEAFFYRVPCVTLRTETEWVELVELGWNRLCPPGDAAQIGAAIASAPGTRGRDAAPYGDGRAAERIVNVLGKTMT